LLDEVERTGQLDAVATRQSHKAAKSRRKQMAGGPAGPLDPFAVTVKMIYVAALIIIVAVAWKYGNAAIKALNSRKSDIVASSPRPSAIPTAGPVETASGAGLLAMRLNPDQEGVYVASVPEGATVYSASGKGGAVSMVHDPQADRHMQTNQPLRLTPGYCTLAIAVRINSPGLMELPGYPELRRKIESREYDDDRLLASYLLPDGAVASGVERIGGLLHLVRAYEVEVPPRTWVPVTALFLPRAPLAELLPHLPGKAGFAFDEAMVRSELGFYGVPEQDQPQVLEALRRMGKVSYQQGTDGPFRLFQIHLRDGVLVSEEVGH
jgi:hypothetical protein